jgi:hypothetical protein
VSLGAFSRVLLGWSPVVEMSQSEQDLDLAAAGVSGVVVRIPVAAGEYFLAEYRRRTAYYDRHVPGEGVLLWHVTPSVGPGDVANSSRVDVECADDRWQDAGYPLGQAAGSNDGGDNLDFWAHDDAYAQAHGGNLGDSTDVYDGVRFTAFTPGTNPSSRGLDGEAGVRVEQIRCLGEQARLRVHTRPVALAILDWLPVDASRNGVIGDEEEVTLLVRVSNTGGLPARDVQLRLRSTDPRVQVLSPLAVATGAAAGDSTAVARRWGIRQTADHGRSWSLPPVGPTADGAPLVALYQDPLGADVVLGSNGWGLLWRGGGQANAWRNRWLGDYSAGPGVGVRRYPAVPGSQWNSQACFAATYTVLASADGGR